MMIRVKSRKGPSLLDKDIQVNTFAAFNFKLYKQIPSQAVKANTPGDEDLVIKAEDVLIDSDTAGFTVELKLLTLRVNVKLVLEAPDVSNLEHDETIGIQDGRLHDKVDIVVTVRHHGISAECTDATVLRLPEKKPTTVRKGQLSDKREKGYRTDPAVDQKAYSVRLPPSSQGKNEFNEKCTSKEKTTQDIVNVDLATYPGATATEPEKEMNFLLRLPYDVRRDIYDSFYPIGRNIQLTNGPPEWNALTPRREAHGITSDGLNLLLSCREIHQEIKRLLYGKNTFLVAPGERDFPCPRSIRPPYGNSRLFLSKLLLSTKQMVKALHLCLGPSLHRNFIGRLPGQLAGFAQVVITVDPLNLTKPTSRAAKQRCIMDACRLIAAARSGLPPNRTLWDDCGDAATARMLEQVLPHGYSSVV